MSVINCTLLLIHIHRVDFVRLGEQNFDSAIDCYKDEHTGKKICNDPPIDVKVSKILIHPRYHKTTMQILHDIALLLLVKSVKYTGKVQSI